MTLLVPIVTSVSAQDNNPVPESREHQTAAIEAYRSGDNQSFLNHSLEAARLRPSHPGLMYNLAAAYTANGDTTQAIAWLDKYADTGSAANVGEAGPFAPLLGNAEFERVLSRLAENRKPVSNSTEAFRLERSDLLTEGIAFDDTTGAFFVSSVHQRLIYRIDPSGQATEFIDGIRDGAWGFFALKVDPVRRILWVGSAAMGQVSGLDSLDAGQSGIFKYDADSGALLKSYILEDDSENVLGDLTVGNNGDVYASDGATPAVYVIRTDDDVLQPLITGDPFVSPQGLAVSEDERFLFVADYSRGIIRVDLDNLDTVILRRPQKDTFLGIDGMVLHGSALIGVQNGTVPHRIVRLHLTEDQEAVERLEVLEANNPVFDEPTQCVIAQDAFYYIANSQWGQFTDTGEIAVVDALEKPVVLRIDLSEM